MTFISFGRSREDVILWRALHGITNGFYIEAARVSAAEETMAQGFYDLGWRGLDLLPDTNRSHSVRSHPILSHRPANITVSSIHAACAALADAPSRAIHFLRIACPGEERGLLQALDLGTNRPWIILIASFDPATQTESKIDWDDLMAAHAYQPVLFDGANHFYLATEHQALAPAFRYPVCARDDYRTATEYAQSDALDLGERVQASLYRAVKSSHVKWQQSEHQAHVDLCEATSHHDRAVAALLDMEQRLITFLASPWWRASAPFRSLVYRFGRLWTKIRPPHENGDADDPAMPPGPDAAMVFNRLARTRY